MLRAGAPNDDRSNQPSSPEAGGAGYDPPRDLTQKGKKFSLCHCSLLCLTDAA